MRIIELGKGMVKIEPCFVSADDRRQALLFEAVGEPHESGVLTGDPAGPHTPKESDTLLILSNVEAAEVLLVQVKRCIDEMRSNANVTGLAPAQEVNHE